MYVFKRTGTWNQTAYIKADNAGTGVAGTSSINSGVGDLFGQSVSLSDDGTILAVSARLEDSNVVGTTGGATGLPDDDSLADSGAVYVFTDDGSGTVWNQTAYIKASNPGAEDRFGQYVSISGNGNTLAVSAYREDSDASGVLMGTGSDGTDASSTDDTGAVYTFTRDGGGAWTQQAYIKAHNTDKDDHFGLSLSLSQDGLTLAVGAEWEKSSDTDVTNGASGGADNSIAKAGAAYVFHFDVGAWTQQAYIKASTPGDGDEFGRAISLSADGNTLAVGARLEDGSVVGIDDTHNDGAETSGAVYTYTRNAGLWSEQATVKASNTDAADEFGWSVSLTENADGLQTLAVGARMEDSNAQGIGGDQTDNSTSEAGAVYLY